MFPFDDVIMIWIEDIRNSREGIPDQNNFVVLILWVSDLDLYVYVIYQAIESVCLAQKTNDLFGSIIWRYQHMQIGT